MGGGVGGGAQEGLAETDSSSCPPTSWLAEPLEPSPAGFRRHQYFRPVVGCLLVSPKGMSIALENPFLKRA